MLGWLFRNRWLGAGGSVLVGVIILFLSKLTKDAWWSGVLVNAGTALFLFAPLAVFGRHIEQRFDDVQGTQEKIEKRQEETSAELATLSEEFSQAQGEIRRTRDELAQIVADRLAASRISDSTTFAEIGDMPSHESLFNSLTRASRLGLINPTGCRVKIDHTGLYLWFEVPQGDQYWNEPPRPEDDLNLRIEEVDGAERDRLTWAHNQAPEDVLVELAEKLISLGQYPGDRLYNSGKVFTDLKELLELAHGSATGGSFEPLTNVIQFCSPQWVITNTHLIAADSSYAIPISRIREEEWHRHMSEKTWLDHDSFSMAFSIARRLFEAGRLAVKPWKDDEEPF